MAIPESVKQFWPLLFTFVLPRAIGYYRALKTAYRTRPPPRPLSKKASRSLNVLFVSVCVFVWLSTSTNSMWREYRNVFSRTQTRLHVSADTLFTRLASSRPDGMLTPDDEALRLKLLTVPARQVYLRYGPNTLLNCPFCHPDEPLTYLLHYLPANILLPHLLHLITVGLATSRSLSGLVASKFRLNFIITSFILLIIDIYTATSVDLPVSSPTNPSPQSIYIGTAVARPLALAISDIILAALIYITATGRFVFFPFLASASAQEDPEELVTRTDRLLNETSIALQMAQMKLRGLNVARNTIARDEGLKNSDARYWEQVRFVEGENGSKIEETVFEDEEVQAAMAKAFGSGNVDVVRLRKDAKGFVDNVTKGLDRPGGPSRQ